MLCCDRSSLEMKCFIVLRFIFQFHQDLLKMRENKFVKELILRQPRILSLPFVSTEVMILAFKHPSASWPRSSPVPVEEAP